jgi:hypothetical protein
MLPHLRSAAYSRVTSAVAACAGFLGACLHTLPTASAHPGHIVEIGEPESWSHYLTHPDHGLPLLALAAVALLMVLYRREAYRRSRTA